MCLIKTTRLLKDAAHTIVMNLNSAGPGHWLEVMLQRRVVEELGGSLVFSGREVGSGYASLPR